MAPRRRGASGAEPDLRLGQLTSMQCGLCAVPADADGVLFTLVDHPAVAPATIAALIDVPLAALLDLTSARPRCCASHDPAAGAGSGHATRKGDRLHRRGRCRHPGGRGRPCGLRDAAGWERRMKRTVKRAAKWLSIAMAVLLMAGIAAPYLSGNRFAPRIQAALESALGRKVELGAIHFSLFAGPGFRGGQGGDPRDPGYRFGADRLCGLLGSGAAAHLDLRHLRRAAGIRFHPAGLRQHRTEKRRVGEKWKS